MKISGQSVFQIPAHSFICSPSESGYVLQYSADGVNFTSYDEETPAGENLIVNGVPKFTYFKLSGNTDENIRIQY